MVLTLKRRKAPVRRGYEDELINRFKLLYDTPKPEPRLVRGLQTVGQKLGLVKRRSVKRLHSSEPLPETMPSAQRAVLMDPILLGHIFTSLQVSSQLEKYEHAKRRRSVLVSSMLVCKVWFFEASRCLYKDGRFININFLVWAAAGFGNARHYLRSMREFEFDEYVQRLCRYADMGPFTHVTDMSVSRPCPWNYRHRRTDHTATTPLSMPKAQLRSVSVHLLRTPVQFYQALVHNYPRLQELFIDTEYTQFLVANQKDYEKLYQGVKTVLTGCRELRQVKLYGSCLLTHELVELLGELKYLERFEYGREDKDAMKGKEWWFTRTSDRYAFYGLRELLCNDAIFDTGSSKTFPKLAVFPSWSFARLTALHVILPEDSICTEAHLLTIARQCHDLVNFTWKDQRYDRLPEHNVAAQAWIEVATNCTKLRTIGIEYTYGFDARENENERQAGRPSFDNIADNDDSEENTLITNIVSRVPALQKFTFKNLQTYATKIVGVNASGLAALAQHCKQLCELDITCNPQRMQLLPDTLRLPSVQWFAINDRPASDYRITFLTNEQLQNLFPNAVNLNPVDSYHNTCNTHSKEYTFN